MDIEMIANIIAGIAVVVALIIFIVQIVYDRKNEWHNACELLFRSFETLYHEINSLVENPQATNLISFQHLLIMRRILFTHYANKFILQRKRINAAERVIIDELMDNRLIPSMRESCLKAQKIMDITPKTLTKKFVLAFIKDAIT
jgi:hypothetical protein